MTDPHDKNDDWADLLQELGVEGAEQPSKVTAKTEPVAAPTEPAYSEEPAEAEVDEAFGFDPGDDAGEASEDDAPEGEADGDDGDEAGSEGEGADEGSPDEPGKKKRRRRRRRRKKGSPEAPEGTEAAVATGTEEDAEEAAVPAEVPVEMLGVDEITPEATREMIAKWNVPSWSEIVAGLYRPER